MMGSRVRWLTTAAMVIGLVALASALRLCVPASTSEDRGAAAAQDGDPCIEFDLHDGVLQLGPVEQGASIRRDVSFRNVGGGALRLASVTTGCGCIKARLANGTTHVSPGVGGRILVVVETVGRVGTLRKRVTLAARGIKGAQWSFHVECDVRLGLVATPCFLRFGDVPPSTPASHSLVLGAPKGDGPWRITGLRSSRAQGEAGKVDYAYTVESVDDPHRLAYRIRVAHPGSAAIGPIRDVLVVEATHPTRRQVRVAMYLSVVPRIRSRLSTINLGSVRAGKPCVPMRARIEAGTSGVEFTVVGVEFRDSAGDPTGVADTAFEASYGKDARGWWVDVAWVGDTRKSGPIEVRLVVLTDDPAQPEVLVPVRATVAAPDPAVAWGPAEGPRPTARSNNPKSHRARACDDD